MDKAEDQKKFKDKNNYTFPLIADTEGVLVKAFGVKLFTPKICARESFRYSGWENSMDRP